MNRPLSEKELAELAENLSDLEDPFHDSNDSRDPDYECSDESIESDKENKFPDKTLDELIDQEGSSSESEISDDESPPVNIVPNSQYLWSRNVDNFSPKKALPNEQKPIVLSSINRGSTPLECFLKMFPRSLILQIAHYTNIRLQILGKKLKREIRETSQGEIKILLGCVLIMSYNRVPAQHMYWSKNKSLGNQAIKEAISRDRLILLMSELYFNNPEKPDNALKTYYIDEVLSCLKKTFLAARTDSTFQSIDESMTKFKGRSSLKQYLPLKPVKRGIKLWTRCDSNTGYVYDTNIYSGKEIEHTEGTLGESVVLKLAETIKNPNVVLCFDRFFTSVTLLDTIQFPCVGTYISTRRHTPKFAKNKLQERGASEMLVCTEGILGIKWKDTKDVYLMSNCHDASLGTITRKMKDGSAKEIQCPDAIIFYNKYMGGVDHADQMISLYDLDRRSSKWWKKVFFRLLMTAVYNSFVIYKEITKRNISFINFIIDVAENLISQGRSETSLKRSRGQGRMSKMVKHCANIGDHLPINKGGRGRCVRCKQRKIEKRTKIICRQCEVPLCVECFTPYHT